MNKLIQRSCFRKCSYTLLMLSDNVPFNLFLIHHIRMYMPFSITYFYDWEENASLLHFPAACLRLFDEIWS